MADKTKTVFIKVIKNIVLSLSFFAVIIGYAQEKKGIDLSFKDITIQELLNNIEKQTDYTFVYDKKKLNLDKKISIKVSDAPISEVLENCFYNSNVRYKISKNKIYLYKVRLVVGKVVDDQGFPLFDVFVRAVNNKSIETSTNRDGVFSFYIPYSVKELEFSMLGLETAIKKVSEITPKEKIVLKSGNQVALGETVSMGVRKISKDNISGSVAVISAKDLKSQGITSIESMMEGKVTGLNSTNLSGAPGTSSKITIRGENNLSGNSEPLWIVDGLPMISGVPRSNTGNYANTIMQNGIGNILPEDIASITILKDAAASSIYGAKAANGVIVITTKRGSRSRTSITYNGNVGINMVPNIQLDMMNSVEKLRYEKSIVDNYGLKYALYAGRGGRLIKEKMEGFILAEDYDKEWSRLSSINTDWFNEIFRTAFSNSHNVNIQGGTDKLAYYTSFGYRSQQGILKSNEYISTNLSAKLDYRPFATEELIFNVDVSLNNTTNKNNASAINPFVYAIFANPYEQPYDENGNYSYDLSYLSGNYSNRTSSGYVYNKFNILKELAETKNVQKGIDGDMTFRVQYKPIKGLILSSHFRKALGMNMYSTEINQGTYTSWVNEEFAKYAYNDTGLFPSIYDNGELTESAAKSESWVLNNKIQYSFNLKNKHFFSTMGFMEIMSRNYNNFMYTSPILYADYRITGIPRFSNEGLTYEKVLPAIEHMFQTFDGQSRSVSFAGLFSYSYANRYILDFNYRADGADIIGDAERFTPLWSVGARYNIHNEKFFKSKFFNELVLRASYGLTGNIDRSAYPFSIIEIGPNFYIGNRYVKNYQYPNPSVKWERKTDRGVGLDVSMFNRRINLTADYYNNRIDDVLTNLKVPKSTGRDKVKANGGIIENSGYEIRLGIKWVDTKDFDFSTSFNFAQNKNKILKSEYDLKSFKELIKSDPVQGGIFNIVGQETGAIYGWKSAGVNPKTGNARYYLTEEGKLAYAKFLDNWDRYSEADKERLLKVIPSLNEIPDYVDHILFESGLSMPFQLPSLQYLGSINPKFVGGISTYIRYKNFTFTTNWSFKAGHIIPTFNDYQNAPKTYAPNDPTIKLLLSKGYSNDFYVSSTNRQRAYLNYWRAPGDITPIRKFVTNGLDFWASMYSSDKYEKGDYIRMTNIAISYRLKPSIARKLYVRDISIGLNARNLLTFTKYKGLDVTTNGTFNYPTSKQVNLNISISF